MKNISFQMRHAWYQSRARALIKWLLVRLGIWVDKSIQETAKGVESAIFMLPIILIIFLCYWWVK